VAVKSYGDVFDDYRMHAEPKSVDVSGMPCRRATKGLLKRRPVCVGRVALMGKEANRIDDVSSGLAHNWGEVRDVVDPPNDPVWDQIVLPRLRGLDRSTLASKAGLTKRQIRNLLAGRSQPSDKTRKVLTQFALIKT
jgi:hypothetical protein